MQRGKGVVDGGFRVGVGIADRQGVEGVVAEKAEGCDGLVGGHVDVSMRERGGQGGSRRPAGHQAGSAWWATSRLKSVETSSTV